MGPNISTVLFESRDKTPSEKPSIHSSSAESLWGSQRETLKASVTGATISFVNGNNAMIKKKIISAN